MNGLYKATNKTLQALVPFLAAPLKRGGIDGIDFIWVIWELCVFLWIYNNYTMKILNILLISAMLLFSCKKKCDLPEQTIGTGEIVENGLVSSVASATTLLMNNQKEYIIQSESLNKDSLRVSYDNGITYEFINFAKYTLLAKYANGQCNTVFERNVSRNDLQKKVYYNIKVHQCGNCKTNCESMNWVLVPKIPNDYTVVFNVTKK